VVEKKRRRSEAGKGKGDGNERKPFLLRVSPNLMAELKIWSNQEFRSLNGQIEFLLQNAVNQRKRKDRSPEDTPS
jgi:hypothetical protein